MDRKIVRQRRVNRAPIFILLALIFLLVGIIVTIFSLFIVEDLNADPMTNVLLPPPPESVESQSPLSGKTPGEILAAALISREESKNNASSTGDTPPVDVVTERVKVETLVPESPKADKSYFDDAVFVGDSVTLGFPELGFIPAKNIIADKNVNLNNVAADDACYQGKTKTLYEMIEKQMPNPKKIYVLLGLNNLPGTANEASMVTYGKIIDRLKATYPDSMIFVQSVTPMTADSEYTKRFSSAKINDFNDRLLALAKEKGVYYLNLQEILKDANGYLVKDYASPDGLHMVKNGHEAMYKYYRTHTVQPDGYTDRIVK